RSKRDWSSDVCSSDLEELVRSRKSAKSAMVVKGVVAAVVLVALFVGAIWLLNNWDEITTPEVAQEIEMPQLVGKLYTDVLADEEIGRASCRERWEGAW